jgi:hypothetical protein
MYRVLDFSQDSGEDSASFRRWDAPPYNQTGVAIFRLDANDTLHREIEGLANFGWFGAWYERPVIVAAPGEPILAVPLHYAGTGNINENAYYRRVEGRWRRLETTSWLSDLRLYLPEGLAIWKGFVPDLATMHAESDVWRPDDANCCPSGGRVVAELGFRGDTLVITRAVYRPPEGNR